MAAPSVSVGSAIAPAVPAVASAAVSARTMVGLMILPPRAEKTSRGVIGSQSGNLKGKMLGSFKLKLVGTFLALSVLPLAAAFWGFSQVAERSVTSSTDDRLEAGLSAALVAFEDERRRAGSAAERLGRDPAFQAAVARDDRATIADLLPASPSLRVEMPGGRTIGPVPPLAAETDVSLLGPGSRSVTIVASVPLTRSLANRLHARSGLTAPDELAVVRFDDSITASSNPSLRGAVDLVPGRVVTETIGGRSYRAIAARLVPEMGIALAAITPSSGIAGEKRSAIERLLFGLVGSLLLIACVAYLAGRSIVERPRPARRGRELDRCGASARARAGSGTRRVRGSRARVQRDGGSAGGSAGGSRGRAPAAARRERPLRRCARIRARPRPASPRDRRIGGRGDAGRRRRS